MWNHLLQEHPDPRKRWAWSATQVGLIFLPFIPVVGALALVASAAHSSRHQGKAILSRPLNWGFGLLAIAMVLVSFGAESRGDALIGLVHFLPYFWLSAAQTELTEHPKQLKQLAQLIVLPVLPLVLIGLAELYLGWSSPLILGGLLPWPLNAAGTPPGRMSSLFGYANNLALYLVITFSLGLGLWGASWKQWRNAGRQVDSVAPLDSSLNTPATDPPATDQQKGQQLDQQTDQQVWHVWGEHWSAQAQLLLWTVVLLANALSVILTQSRSAWGLMALSALAAAIYLRWTLIVSAVVGFTAAVLGSAFSPIGQAPLRRIIPAFIWTRLTDQNFPDRPLPTLRKTQWQFTLDLMQQRPWKGWGLRNFSALYEAQTQVWMGHPHNLFLMLGAEIGIPLTVGLLLLMGWIFYRASRYLLTSKKDKNWIDYHCIFGAFLLALVNITLFHGFDVLFFDFRINAMAWMVVAQIRGEFSLSSVGNLSLRRSGSP